MARYFVLLLIFLLIICSDKAFAGGQSTTHFPPYRYIHDEQDSLLVKKLHARITPRLNVMEHFLGKKLHQPLTIVMTRSEEEYYTATRGRLPEWSQAAVFIRERMIYLKITSGDDLLQSPGVLLHELAHIICYEKSRGQPLPAWLNEGLAQYLSGQSLTTRQKIVLSRAILAKNVIRLMALDTLFQFSRNRAELAYAQALSAVEFIEEEYGKEKLSDLLNGIADGNNFFPVFKEELGTDFIDFEYSWYEYIFNEYRWLILLDFDNFLWFLMVVLFVMALLAVRWRNRRKIKKWQEEEVNIVEELN